MNSNQISIHTPALTGAQSLRKVALGCVALTLGAYFEVKIPGTVVPFTFQSLVVLCIGFLYSPKLSFLTIGIYLTLGSLGAPLWSGSSFGLAHLLGPTGGYLVGFLLAGPFLSLSRSVLTTRSTVLKTTLLLLAQMIIYAFGLTGLAQFVGPQQALALGFLPFIPALIVKTALGLSIWTLLDSHSKYPLLQR